MAAQLKLQGFQMSPEKKETLLKMTILTVAAILCKFFQPYN